MKLSVKYGSFLPVLLKLYEITKGSIMELGLGIYSTPLLHWMCFADKRKLLSYDGDENWVNGFRSFRSDNHKLTYIASWDELEINDFWDIVLIDHAPAFRRTIEAKRLANNAKYLILHDSEPELDHIYQYSKAYPFFKYRNDYKVTKPYTTVLSNFKDFKNLKI